MKHRKKDSEILMMMELNFFVYDINLYIFTYLNLNFFKTYLTLNNRQKQKMLKRFFESKKRGAKNHFNRKSFYINFFSLSDASSIITMSLSNRANFLTSYLEWKIIFYKLPNNMNSLKCAVCI